MNNTPNIEKRSRRHQLKNVCAKIRKVLLLHWDPVGVRNFVDAQDEYDSYIYPIYRLLLLQASDEDVKAYLMSVEHDSMGLRCQTRQEHLNDVVKLLRLAISGSSSVSERQAQRDDDNNDDENV